MFVIEFSSVEKTNARHLEVNNPWTNQHLSKFEIRTKVGYDKKHKSSRIGTHFLYPDGKQSKTSNKKTADTLSDSTDMFSHLSTR